MSVRPAASIGLLGGLVEEAIEAGSLRPADQTAAQILLADFLACVLGADDSAAPPGWAGDGTVGIAAALAARSHARDQDDVHWSTAVHPGSVVWPVVLAVGTEVGATGDRVASAARAGYQAMTGLARLLGPAHGRSWHATATCGVLGAVVPAAMLLELDADERDWACGHAVAVAGGVGQAVVERSASTRFHRIAAAALGIQGARFGQARVPCSERVLEGKRGLLTLLAPDADAVPPVDSAVGDALEETSVRVFPVNGLSQSAVALAADLSRAAQSAPTRLVVEVPAHVAAATTGDVGGAWWDLRSAVAAAWTTGDPFRLAPTRESAVLRERVKVVQGSAAWSTTRVTAHTAFGEQGAQLDSAPGTSLRDPELLMLLERKWDLMVGSALGEARHVRSMADSVLRNGPRPDDLSALLS